METAMARELLGMSSPKLPQGGIHEILPRTNIGNSIEPHSLGCADMGSLGGYEGCGFVLSPCGGPCCIIAASVGVDKGFMWAVQKPHQSHITLISSGPPGPK